MRRGALIWGAVFGTLVATTIASYESAFPAAADRTKFALALAENRGLQALTGQGLGVDEIQGFVAWRMGGLLPAIAAVWGLLAATRLMRGEEEAGRWEVLIAGPISPARGALACLAAVGAALGAMWVITAALTVAVGAGHDFPLVGSLYLALALVVAGAVFAAAGGLAAQIAATRRQAAAIAAAFFGVALLLRMAADSSSNLDWLRWLTPLGWVEELHPLADPQPLALIPIALLTAALGGAAVHLAGRRDLGDSVVRTRDRSQADTRMLGSPAGHAVRSARGPLIGWVTGVGCAAFVFALISDSVSKLASGSVAQQNEGLGVDISSAEGYLGLTFLFLIVAVCLYGASQVAHTREEEAGGQLDELLAQPVGRLGWLGARLMVAAACLAVVALAAGLFGWAGALVGGADVPLSRMLEAGVNALPVALLFLGLGTLAFGVVPREASAVAYGAVILTFLIEIVGGTVDAPAWLLDLSPFHHLALAPRESIEVGSALALGGLGLATGVAGAVAFGRRDLASA